MNDARRQSGMTLVELMVTVAVMAVTASIALPALGAMSAGNSLNTTQENIVETLKKARGMAVSHSTFATVDVNAAARTVQLSLADGSQQPEMLHIPQNIRIGADARLVFSAQGRVTAQAGTTSLALSSISYALPQRRIDVSPTGVVSAAR